MTSDSRARNADGGSFDIKSRLAPGALGGGITYATITCRTCGKTEDAPLRNKNAGWARRAFKGRGWTVGERIGRHQCPACAQGVRGLAGKSVREVRADAIRNVGMRMERKHPGSAKALDLFGASALGNGVLEVHRVLGGNPAGPDTLQDIDPDLLEPDRMAEALSRLGRVTKHPEEASPVSEPIAPKARWGHGPAKVVWKGTPSNSKGLPISPKPLNLPDFLLPPAPHRQHRRKLKSYRYPGDAAVIARLYLKTWGVSDPQIGRDFIVWAEADEIGWAPILPNKAQAPAPEPTITTTVEPVTTPEEPIMAVAPTPIPPPRPTRDKLLAIHEKLNLVYLTDAGGRYTGVWTDAKVAHDLDVPTAWVTEERARVYGEGTDNEASHMALDRWKRDLTNRMAKATERQAKAVEELLAVNTEIEAIKASLSAGPRETA
jgi:hypothetical protein